MATHEYLAPPQAPPELNIPESQSTVIVAAIDSGTRVEAPIKYFADPQIGNYTNLKCPAYSFLIQHQSGRSVIFDLGVRKDISGLPPHMLKRLDDGGFHVDIKKDVADVLDGENIPRESIEAIIWSHHHFDHTGDPSTFPSSTALLVGPGFKENMLPGYPDNEMGQILKSDYEGRELREIDFDKDANGLRVGPFKALDYFGDGSFYLLQTPGHTIDHMCALARTSSSPPAFIYLGGDVCHHGGEIRPSKFLPLPKQVSPNPLPHIHTGSFCPGEALLDIHPEKSATEAFYRLAEGLPWDPAAAKESLKGTQEFDAQAEVLILFAHDHTVVDALPFLPKKLNGWEKDTDIKEGLRWAFLEDFASAVQSA